MQCSYPKSYGAPAITKDGVSVAKEVELLTLLQIWRSSRREVASKPPTRQVMGQLRQPFLHIHLQEGLRNITTGVPDPFAVKMRYG